MPAPRDIKVLKRIKSKKSGFTLVELTISLAVLVLIVLFSFAIYSNFFDAMRNLRANNLVYEETRFLMNKMVREVRSNTVDYEEYWNQSDLRNQFPNNYDYLRNENYGQNYCEYSRQFYTPGDDGEIGTLDDQNTGERNTIDPADGISEVPPAIGILDDLNNDVASPIQNDLFLINVSGNERTYIKLIEGTDSLGNTIGQVGLLKMEGEDFGVDHLNAFDPKLDGSIPGGSCTTDLGEGDGRIDTWVCQDGFPCQVEDFINANLCSGKVHTVINDPSTPADSSFVAISPNTLDVTDLKFIVGPMDDPRKSYKVNELQIQPHVTVKITAQATTSLSTKLRTTRQPSLSLDSTISTRVYSEIVSECNLKQCNPGVSADKSCPLSAGVCGPVVVGNPSASQSCTNYVWEGCNTATYTAFANTNHGQPGVDFPGNSTTYFESGSEYQSCEDDLTSCTLGCLGDIVCIAACQTTAEDCRDHRCSDGVDNDCSGAADDQDNACISSLCSDGAYDVAVEGANGCIDVGGSCQAINPLQNDGESVCNDGLDNDCDGFADQFDADCVVEYCSNGSNDPNGATTSYTQPPVNLFLALGYSPQNYLFDAVAGDYAGSFLDECDGGVLPSPDVAGICSTCYDTATGNSICDCGTPGCTDTKIVPGHDLTGTESACSDGIDNDCDGDADEFDSDCQSVLCEDGGQSCDLVPTDYTPIDYLGNYSSLTCDTGATDTDEICEDVGGLCQGYFDGSGFDHSLQGAETGAALCADGLDNDCDGAVDWADVDGGCCGFGDYCIDNANTSFIDSLTSADYLASVDAGIDHNLIAGEIQLIDINSIDLLATSSLLPLDVSSCGSFDLSLTGTTFSEPAGSQLLFQLSDDNGVTWCGNDDCAGDFITTAELAAESVNFSGSSLLWRASLSGFGVANPTLTEVSVNYSNCSP